MFIVANCVKFSIHFKTRVTSKLSVLARTAQTKPKDSYISFAY